ncbi:glutathionylspermidine synthase family protein [Marinobacterium sp. D7]|uniref:glutathionylspermidine synthase family protein n=1 Tax=Marinobacterium ramblicola TaxID=2849041 RepID=UPI001C2D7AC1|nr:glutathionylspermidine synthase family protein [Marinobacterium ramblicola]MBV1787409.1 glutathionylspermidine synthase family protein [Marinobacterium ramblicola]
MLRIPVQERSDWQQTAVEYGFKFHTMYGEKYWDESAYYQFTLKQIEDHIEDPTAELHQMSLEVVDRVVRSEELMQRFRIPERYWDQVAGSWQKRDPSLYSRLDLIYDGVGPAKCLEFNSDTPTSLYESGFWSWLWLEQMVKRGSLPRAADQFTSLQEKLISRFAQLEQAHPGELLHLACCKDTEEDLGTITYLSDCAQAAGIATKLIFVEDIGHGEGDWLTDPDDQVIRWMFKLYPWEFMLREEFADLIGASDVSWLEPIWKSITSNKALLPMLWKLFPEHPNLLPAYFEDEVARAEESRLVKKPIFSREGANISILDNGKEVLTSDGPYGEEGFVYQAYHPMPQFADNYTLVGSWLVDDQPAGISVREDTQAITQDLSRFLPHIILG